MMVSVRDCMTFGVEVVRIKAFLMVEMIDKPASLIIGQNSTPSSAVYIYISLLMDELGSG